MSWYRRLINVVRSNRLSKELDREIAFHLAERRDQLAAGGMTERDAAYEARRRFGNRTLQKERTHDEDALAWLESLVADIRYAVRALLHSPGFALVAILSLALGIGANTAIFSLTNALILKPLPVSHPEQLLKVSFGLADAAIGEIGAGGVDEFTNPLWERIRDQTKPYAGSLAFASTGFNLAKGGVERRTRGSWVSGAFFDVLGVRPVAGRLLQASDDHRGCAGAVAVSAGFAEREFGGVASALGKTVSLDGHPLDVVGVVEPEFSGLEVGRSADVYVPLCAQALFFSPDVLDIRARWFLNIIVRPNDGVTASQAHARIAAAAPGIFTATLPPRYSGGDKAEYLRNSLAASPAATGFSELRGRYRLALLTLMVVVGVVLLIACANIANLLLARAAARQREFAIRLAVGAGRWRIVRQLLTESLLLSLTGAALGILFAQWASGLLVGFLSNGDRPVWLDLSIDYRVLGFTVAIAAGTAVLFGLAPAWRATRVAPQSALKSGGRGATGGDARHRLGKTLVVAQVALSLALVAASGLLLGSFRKLVTLDPGFRREGVLLVEMDFGNAGYKGDRLNAVQSDLLRRLRALPGVTDASVSLLTPIGRMSWNEFVVVPGYVPASRSDSLVYFNEVTDGYFSTLGTALLAGRDFTGEDITQNRRVAVINETMAHRFFGSTSPLGRSFRTPDGDTLTPPRQVVGVVRDAKYQKLEEKTLATAYMPLGQGGIPLTDVTYSIRSTGAPAALVGAVRSAVAEANPAISLGIETFEAQVSGSLARPRLLASLSAFFGALALLLAVIGLYGTMSYNVTRRRNEIGIRMALGAANRQVLRMVVGEAGRLIVLGIVVGAALALAGTRLVSTFLYGLTATDPTTFALSALSLAIAALAAAFLPAWRAARLDPMEALREE